MRKPVRVVIADDHQVLREGLQMILADSDGEIVLDVKEREAPAPEPEPAATA